MEITFTQEELDYTRSLEECGIDFVAIIIQLLAVAPVNLFVYEESPETPEESEEAV